MARSRLRTLLKRVFATNHRTCVSKPLRPTALQVEGLEARWVPTIDVFTPQASSLVEGTASAVTVATFHDTDPLQLGTDYTVSIDWGDGSPPDTGTVSDDDGAGNHTVTGTHNYADEGTFTVTVAVLDTADPDTAGPGSATATVGEADVFAAVTSSVAATEGTTFAGQVATFTNSGFQTNPSSDFTASIDWGDGTITAGTLTDDGAGNITVSGTHKYLDEGTFALSVTLADVDDDGSGQATATATATGTATIGEADVFAAGTASVAATEGSAFAGQVATFTNTGFATNPSIDFTASVDWGDGTITAGTLTDDGAGNITVSGTHKYSDEGTFALSVTLADADDGSGQATATATATGTATVGEADVFAAGTAVVAATEGTGFTGQVATFTNAGFATNPSSDFTASIDWGDGTTTTGTLADDGAGNITVSGAHKYLDEGTFALSVTLTDTDDDGSGQATATATATGTATVGEADVFAAGSAAVAATEGTAFNGQVATFTNTGFQTNPSSDFTASIDWGDGTTTTGTLADDGAGNITVSGTHKYSDEGTFALSVTLTDADDDGSGQATATAKATGTATVGEADVFTAGTATVAATEGTAFTGQVVTFTNTGFATNPSGDFTASIDWGDGTTTSGTLADDGAGHITVSGSHTYANEGSFPLSVTITDSDDDGSGQATAAATATGTASVADQAVNVTASALILQAGVDYGSLVVATFTDPAGAEAVSHYGVDVAWGDGLGDRGVVTFDSASGVFSVHAGHVYGHEGFYTVTVTVHHDTAADATSTATASVADAPVFLTSFTPPRAVGTFFGPVTTFVDYDNSGVPSSFSVKISWGDGTSSAGTVYETGVDSFGHVNFIVYGYHSYAAAATAPFRVEVQDLSGSTYTTLATDGQGALEYTVYFDSATGTYKFIQYHY